MLMICSMHDTQNDYVYNVDDVPEDGVHEVDDNDGYAFHDDKVNYIHDAPFCP